MSVGFFLQLIAGVFTILAALFTFLEISHNDEHESVRDWFRQKWIIINSSPWLVLPEIVINYTIRLKNSLLNSLYELKDNVYFFIVALILGFLLILSGLWLYWGRNFAIFLFICYIFIFKLYSKFIEYKEDNFDFTTLLFSLIVLAFAVLILIIWIRIWLQMDIYYATLVAFFFIPSSWVLLFIFIALLSGMFGGLYYDVKRIIDIYREEGKIKFWEVINTSSEKEFSLNNSILISTTFSLSLFITLFAILIGHFISPNEWLPQTYQMLISNVFFDGITILTTFYLLSWAIEKKSMLRIPIAILTDLFLATIYAILSLYSGLIFTSHALSMGQVIDTLIVMSLMKGVFDFGPFFWTMHTTFLPTVFYLGLICLALIDKAILIPINWFFEKGQEHKNPLKLTAALWSLFAVVFGVLSFLV